MAHHRVSMLPTSRPLIAVSTSEVRQGKAVKLTPHGEPPQHEMALGLKYMHAIEAAGGLPVVVPPLAPGLAHALVGRVAGVCLSGGPDLDPKSYGKRRHSQTGPTERQLDVFELELARAAVARGLPILAICRGMQVLNVACGGTLHQHLPDVVGKRVCHRQRQPGKRVTHRVTLERASRLAGILGADRFKVNSFHHQAVAKLGAGLTISGRASDGTIESVESTADLFMVGVQWHAECLVDRPAQAAIFAAFIEAARAEEQVPLRQAA